MVHRGPHEFNNAFVWCRPAGPFRRLTEEQVDAYDQNGFFVVPDAFDRTTVDEMVNEIDRTEARLAAVLSRRGRHDVPPTDFTITSNLVLRSPTLKRICASGVLADIALDLLGPNVRLYWEQAVYKKPYTTRTFPWHQDNGKTYVEPQQYITCWVALTDATEDNGCPVIAAALHRMGTLKHWQSDEGWTCLEGPVEAVPVPLTAGSVAVFSSVTTHMTFGNRTGSTRKAYVVQYIPDGAVALASAPDGSIVTTAQDDPDRQFLVTPDRVT